MNRTRIPEALTWMRVRYPEIDRMGVAHHSHHFVWFELGRTEWMRELGVPYSTIEDENAVYLPVVEARAEYHAPARYDERLRIRTRLAWVKRVSMRLEYEIHSEDDRLIASGHTIHAATDGGGRPRRLPEALVRAMGKTT